MFIRVLIFGLINFLTFESDRAYFNLRVLSLCFWSDSQHFALISVATMSTISVCIFKSNKCTVCLISVFICWVLVSLL